MISPDIKLHICEYLAESKSFDTLERLKRASKEWCHTVLSIQWGEYSNELWLKSYVLNDDTISTRASNLELREKVMSIFQNAFAEYGRYFVKHAKFYKIDDHRNYQWPKVECPNLKSFSATGDTKMLRKLNKFIKLNPTITRVALKIEWEGNMTNDQELSNLPKIKVFKLLSCNSKNIRQIIISGAIVHAPSVSYILNSFPNLTRLRVDDLSVKDISDILVPNNATNLPSRKKQYTNITHFTIGIIYKLKTNSQIRQSEVMSLDLTHLFPNLSSLDIVTNLEPNFLISDGNTDILKCQSLAPRSPLLQLSKLQIHAINLDIASSLKSECPNLRKLSIYGFSNAGNVDMYDIMRIISKSFPQLEQFEFDFQLIKGRSSGYSYPLHGSVFFRQSANTKRIFSENPSATAKELGLSFKTPIKFDWPKLREISICGKESVSSRILFALSQFENLVKLRSEFFNLTVIDTLRQRENDERQTYTDQSKLSFPNLIQLKIKFFGHSGLSFDKCKEFIELFPSLKIFYILYDKDYHGDLWKEASEQFPNIVFDIKFNPDSEF